MPTLPIESITVLPSRQRGKIDDSALSDLCDSIRINGLLHPVVVRQTPEGAVLVAGERRLRAAENLSLLGEGMRFAGEVCPAGSIPVTDLGALSPLAAAEAELEENIRRVDLSWQDRAGAEARLVELRRAQAEAKGLSPPTQLELGKELAPGFTEGVQLQRVRKVMALSAAMKDDPNVAKAASEADAWKLIQRKEQSKRDSALGLLAGSIDADERFKLYHADCRNWLRDAPAGQFDCILIDPPYGMGADSFGDGAGRLTGIEHGYSDDPDSAVQLMRDISRPLYDVAKAESHLYVWCDIDLFIRLRDIFAEAGFWTHRTPLINIKREGGRVPWPEHGPRRCYELVLYAVKGKKPTTAIYRDVFESTLERDSDGHGAAKPVEAYVDLLRRSCRPGDSILDCFAGTGTILAAAAQLKLRAVAVERDAAYYGQCVRRLEEIRNVASLPTV